MATIGTFKKTANAGEFVGEIVTLSVQAKGVRIVPDANRANENAPSHRVMVGRAEIGAAWTKQSNEGREYLGLKLDFVGHIPADEHMARATNLGRSVIDAFPMATVSRAFTALAGRLGYRRQNAAMPATCS